MLSKILKELRNEKGYTQNELAKIMGITQDSISLWEKGKRTPDTQYLIEYCKIFDISADYLLGLSENSAYRNSPSVTLTAEEKELLALFRRMPHNAKVKAKAYCEGLVDAPASSNKLA